MKIRNKNFLFILIFFLHCVYYAQSLISAEYFFDVKTEFGDGTSLPINQEINTNQTFNLDTNDLSIGFHTLFIRVKDSEGIWSLYDKKQFYLLNLENFNSKIINAEYFFDVETKFGKGTKISIPDNFDGTLDTDIETKGLSDGEHLLFVRVQNEIGEWSLYDVVTFTIDRNLNIEDFSSIVSIFPNPVNNKINIDSNLKLQSYELYDTNGKIVSQNILSEKGIQINNLSKGVYFLILTSEKGKIAKKIIKK